MSANAIDVRKAVAYAVLTSTGDRIGVRKAQAYAVLDSTATISVRKAVGYAVLFDTTISLSQGNTADYLDLAIGLSVLTVH